jgi:hypothetical protein
LEGHALPDLSAAAKEAPPIRGQIALLSTVFTAGLAAIPQSESTNLR